MKIGIGNDHVAVEYKKEITQYIQDKYGLEQIVPKGLIILLLVKPLQMR